MVGNTPLDATRSVDPAPPPAPRGDLAEELAGLAAAAAAQDADEPLARETVESRFFPGVPLS
jgi:hypothetical protein